MRHIPLHLCIALIINELLIHIIWQCKTVRFRTQNGPFRKLKWTVSQAEMIRFRMM
jgi:hypothetical protein